MLSVLKGSFLAFVFLLASSLPSYAAPQSYPTGYQDYTFYRFTDNNGNGFLDTWGGDYCETGYSDGEMFTLTKWSNQQNVSVTYKIQYFTTPRFVVNNSTSYIKCLNETVAFATVEAPDVLYAIEDDDDLSYFTSLYDNSPTVTFAVGVRQ
jgi:hypothetical protein